MAVLPLPTAPHHCAGPLSQFISKLKERRKRRRGGGSGGGSGDGSGGGSSGGSGGDGDGDSEDDEEEPEGDKSGNYTTRDVPPSTSWAGTTVTTASILYHGGPLMVSGVNVYIIWYGAIAESQKAVIRTFIASLSDTSMASVNGSVYQWYNIARLYYDNGGYHPTEAVTLAVSNSAPRDVAV